MLNATMRLCHRMMQANSSRNPRETEASQNMDDGTLSLKYRELKDSEVVDIIKLAPEGHGITQDVGSVWDAVTAHGIQQQPHY
jgi:hypothetical protein